MGAGETVFTIPVTGTVDPAFTSGLQAMLGQFGGIAGVATELKAKIDLVRMAFAELTQMGDRVAALASEQEMLERQSARLGVNFDQAAQAAGRFTDETDAMAAAARFAEAGFRLTQEQLDAVTRRAAVLSQNLGVDMRTALDQTYTAVVAGSERALRPFGAAMQAAAGDSHTMAERMMILQGETRRMAAATNTATDNVEALRDAWGDMTRAGAAGIVDGITIALRGQNTELNATAATMRSIRGFFAEFTVSSVGMFNAVVDGLRIVGVSIMAPFQQIARAMQMIQRGHYQDALAALSGTTPEATAAWATFERHRTEEAAGRAAARAPSAPLPPGVVSSVSSTAYGPEMPTGPARRPAGGGARAAGLPSVGAIAGAAVDDLVTQQLAMDAARRREAVGAEMAGPGMNMATAEQATQTAALADAAWADRDRTQLTQRAARMATYTGQVEELLQRQSRAYESAATNVQTAYTIMTQAASTHLTALVLGTETAKQALQGMLRDFMTSLAKEMATRAAFHAIAAIGSAASMNFGGAALHLAAAAGYTALAALTGYGAQLLAPAPAAAAAGGTAAGGSSGRAAGIGSASTQGGTGGVVAVTYNYYAPVIGRRESTNAETGAALGQYADDNARRRR